MSDLKILLVCIGSMVLAGHAKSLADDVSELRSGVPVSGIARTEGSTSRWAMHMPPSAGSVSCEISGGTEGVGDADLYTRWDDEVDMSNPFVNTVSHIATVSTRKPCQYL